MQNSDKILTRYRHHTCKFKHVCMCLYLFQKCRHHTGSIETQYCSGEIHIHTHSSTYMHILFCLYWIQTCMYPIQTCMYDVCMCMYFFAHTYKISQLLCCLYVLKNTYKYKHAGSLMKCASKLTPGPATHKTLSPVQNRDPDSNNISVKTTWES
jgi:hypothetical protein